MRIWDLLVIAGALSMDAFAVAVCMGLGVSGAAGQQPQLQRQLLVTAATAGVYFGLFQAVMPLVGWLLAGWLAAYVAAFDHWVVFALLGFIGGKMAWEGLRGGEECPVPSLRPRRMVALALATSVDAMAVGVTFALSGVHIGGAVATIGAVTAVLSAAGVLLGRLAGGKLRGRAELVGGVVLIGMGVKMLVEGLMGK